MRSVYALLSGLIFGAGLLISGMLNPAKVQNFLDIFGTWDPSLAFVMGGAIAVAAPGYILLFKRPRPILESKFHVPTSTKIDPRLIGGSAIFGAGWGLGGFCPGPAVASIGLLGQETLIFVVAMLAGMWLAKLASTTFLAKVEA